MIRCVDFSLKTHCLTEYLANHIPNQEPAFRSRLHQTLVAQLQVKWKEHISTSTEVRKNTAYTLDETESVWVSSKTCYLPFEKERQQLIIVGCLLMSRAMNGTHIVFNQQYGLWFWWNLGNLAIACHLSVLWLEVGDVVAPSVPFKKWNLSGATRLPILGGIKQYKCIVSLRDSPYSDWCIVWFGNLMTPVDWNLTSCKETCWQFGEIFAWCFPISGWRALPNLIQNVSSAPCL